MNEWSREYTTAEVVEMMEKAESTFLIKEINDAWRAPIKQALTGAWDYDERVKIRQVVMVVDMAPRTALILMIPAYPPPSGEVAYILALSAIASRSRLNGSSSAIGGKSARETNQTPAGK